MAILSALAIANTPETSDRNEASRGVFQAVPAVFGFSKDQAFLIEHHVPGVRRSGDLLRAAPGAGTVGFGSGDELISRDRCGEDEDFQRLVRIEGLGPKHVGLEAIEVGVLRYGLAFGLLEFITGQGSRAEQAHRTGDDRFADEAFYPFEEPARLFT